MTKETVPTKKEAGNNEEEAQEMNIDTYACDGQIELFDILKPEEDEPAHWIPIRRGERGYSAGDFCCSACGKPCPCWKLTRFCPECGHKMAEKGKEHHEND